MDFDKNSTISEQMQPAFDAFPGKIKDEKIRKGLTSQQLSDMSGVPTATINRIITGAVINPGIFSAAALCVTLGMSLDDLMGTAPQDEGTAELAQLRQELAHKEELLAEKEKAIALLHERSDMMDREIVTLNAQMREMRRTWKPLLYGLCGLCILLTIVWGVYVVLDAQQPDIGLIRSGAVSPLIWVGAAAVVVLLIMLLHFTVSRFYRKIR